MNPRGTASDDLTALAMAADQWPSRPKGVDMQDRRTSRIRRDHAAYPWWSMGCRIAISSEEETTPEG